MFVPLTLTRAGTYRLSVEVTDAEKRVRLQLFFGSVTPKHKSCLTLESVLAVLLSPMLECWRGSFLRSGGLWLALSLTHCCTEQLEGLQHSPSASLDGLGCHGHLASTIVAYHSLLPFMMLLMSFLVS